MDNSMISIKNLPETEQKPFSCPGDGRRVQIDKQTHEKFAYCLACPRCGDCVLKKNTLGSLQRGDKK